MSDLATLRANVDVKLAAFEAACLPHYGTNEGRWGAFKALDRGDAVPESVIQAMDGYIAATHAHYVARDGEHGFLGGRGL